MSSRNQFVAAEPINPEDLNLKPSKTKRKPVGLGDVVGSIAQPIAGAIDYIAGTKIQSCGGCAKRKKFLNEKFPKI